jgi:hypothetical protein
MGRVGRHPSRHLGSKAQHPHRQCSRTRQSHARRQQHASQRANCLQPHQHRRGRVREGGCRMITTASSASAT